MQPLSAPRSETTNLIAGDVYRRLGVEPFINCAGVRTNHGGTNASAPVRAAMEEAANAFVDLDELAEAIGTRIRQLTGAPWGIVTAGSAASLALAAAACVAGNDPAAMLRLPAPVDAPKRILISAKRRFAYEHALRLCGAELVAVETLAAFERAFDRETVLVCLLGRAASDPELNLAELARCAHVRGVPVLVDAAGLSPANPDRFLALGADLVAYSGAKYLHGPQSTGFLIGDENLCRAAWLNGPPHQSFGRCMKIGKEEMVGAITALEEWILRHDAASERQRWVDHLAIVGAHVAAIDGVRIELLDATSAVTAVRLRIDWNDAATQIESDQLRRTLLSGSPRILIHDFWATARSVVIDPINLTEAEADLVGEAIARALRADAPQRTPVLQAQPVLPPIGGTWRMEIRFLHGTRAHRLNLVQEGTRISGWHAGSLSAGPVEGKLDGDFLEMVSLHASGAMQIRYAFEGHAVEGHMEGAVSLGAAASDQLGTVFNNQFGRATWSARRIGADFHG